MRRIRVFLDSSVIIAGIAWAAGGSHEVLALAELGVIAPCLSEEVVAEVLGNVQKKLPGYLGSYYALFKALSFRVIDASPEDLEHARSMINEKDAPILAAAISGRVDWLLSLDKHLLDEALRKQVGFGIRTPGDFLKKLADLLREGRD